MCCKWWHVLVVACFFHMSSVCQKRYDIMKSDGSTWKFHIPSSEAFRGCLAHPFITSCFVILLCFAWWGIYCPLQLGNFFGDFRKFCFARNIGDFRKFCFTRNYLCPLMGYLLSPPSWQFLEIFGSFVSSVIFVPFVSAIFWQFLEIFVSRVIICALQFCGVSCFLEQFPVLGGAIVKM
jgi:hypothetical protein